MIPAPATTATSPARGAGRLKGDGDHRVATTPAPMEDTMLIPDPSRYELRPLGDSCLLLTFVGDDADWTWRKAHSITNQLRDRRHPFLVSAYATFDTTLIEFDPLAARSDVVAAYVVEVIAGYTDAYEAWAREARTFRVPVVYTTEVGGDLADVAAEHGMSITEFAAEHTSQPFTVRLLMGGGTPMLANPTRTRGVRRLASPVIRSARSGSISMAGDQCLLSLADGPRSTTGWRAVARSPIDFGVPSHSDPRSGPFRIGDRIHFDSVAPERWSDFEGSPLSEVIV